MTRSCPSATRMSSSWVQSSNARVASVVWALTGLGFFYVMVSAGLAQGGTLAQVLAAPTTFLMAAAIIVPIAIMLVYLWLAKRAGAFDAL